MTKVGSKRIEFEKDKAAKEPLRPEIALSFGCLLDWMLGTSAPIEGNMSTLNFITYDQSKTLFPNKSNQLLQQHGEELIRAHIAKCFEQSEPSFSFLPQQRVYASKQGPNLRRTVKLDPVAEYYIYDVVYRHRARFRKPHQESRTHFGYRYQGG